MSQAPELSVVIPCRNVDDTLSAQLEALSRQTATFAWEVVVVDNGSSDRTADVARSFAGRLRLRVLTCPTPGINLARNAGVQAAEAELIAICDGDDIVSAQWVEAMRGALENHDYVTGPVELDLLNPPGLAASRGRGSAGGIPWVGSAFPYARGCNMGVRRSVLARVGWFSEGNAYLDDQELGMRMYLAGVIVHLEPLAVVHYRYRSDPRAIWSQGFFYGFNRAGLHALIRRSGLPGVSRLAGWRSWAWLLVGLPGMATRSTRPAYLWVLANRIGQLCGSVRWRSLFL